MEENQQKQQKNGAGIFIIIGVIVLAVAAYFIVKAVNKKEAKSPAVSIAEADRLEVSPINVYGKWNKQENGSRFELNLRSTGELIYTQYDKDGNELAKSDEGTFEVENGSLRLIMTSQGAAFNELYGAVVSSRQLVLTKTEGSGLFAGAYERDMEGVNLDAISEALISETESAISVVESSTTTKENSNPVVESSEPESVVSKPESVVSKPESVVSKPESVVSIPNEVDVPDYEHLSHRISGLLSETADDLFAESSTAPQRYDFSQAPAGGLLTIDGYPIGVMFDHYMTNEGTLLKDEYEPKLLFITVPTEMFFSYNGIKGKQSYTLGELQEIYGDKLSCEYVNDEMYGVKGYKIETVIDGYRVQFNADRDTYLGTIETPITNCVVHAVQPQQTNNDMPRAVFEKDARNINNSEDTMEVWFTTDSAFKSNVKYNLRIYFSDIPDAEYELKYDEPFDTSQNHLTLKLHEGHNYYYIQFTANGQEGEPSNIIYQRYDNPSVWDN